MSIHQSLHHSESDYRQYENWFAQPEQADLVSAIDRELQQTLPECYGYHLLQLGALSQQAAWLSASLIHHSFGISPDRNPLGHGVVVTADYQLLPLASGSIDAVVLTPLLEFVENPQALLAEIWRVLRPEGRLIIIGFNPFSSWRWTAAYRSIIGLPRLKRLVNAWRLCQWLTDNDYQLLSINKRFIQLPLQYQQPYRTLLHWLQILGKFFGSFYVVTAKKVALSLTPIRPKWKQPAKALATKLAEPAPGSFQDQADYEKTR